MTTFGDRPTVLVCMQHYLPGFKAGGPIRSVRAIVENLASEFKFKIITYDRDLGDARPYPNIETMKWVVSDFADICYIPRTRYRWIGMAKLLRTTRAELLYLQSLTHPLFTFFPAAMQRMGLTRCRNLLLAPRGELSPGALSIRPIRKRLYISLTRGVNLFGHGHWHASSEIEARQIRDAYGSRKKPATPSIAIAGALLPRAGSVTAVTHEKKSCLAITERELNILFVSRICPMKNLDYAIRMLSRCKKRIRFSIYGPVDRDAGYWTTCRDLLSRLPENVTAEYMGQIAPGNLPEVYRSHDLLLLPTKGENFGHVIAESLQCGCPVMISDRTPWQGVDKCGAGWIFSLDDPNAFVSTIDEVANWDEMRFASARESAMNYAATHLNSIESIQTNRDMLAYCCSS